jgi:hypothetical protein
MSWLPLRQQTLERSLSMLGIPGRGECVSGMNAKALPGRWSAGLRAEAERRLGREIRWTFTPPRNRFCVHHLYWMLSSRAASLEQYRQNMPSTRRHVVGLRSELHRGSQPDHGASLSPTDKLRNWALADYWCAAASKRHLAHHPIEPSHDGVTVETLRGN